MAYLRREKEIVEIDFSLSKVWETIPKTLASLEWVVHEIDQIKHQIKTSTKPGFMLYSSTLLINVTSMNKNTSRITVAIETPVTTITAMAEFGRTRERLYLFFETLARHLEEQTQKSGKNDFSHI